MASRNKNEHHLCQFLKKACPLLPRQFILVVSIWVYWIGRKAITDTHTMKPHLCCSCRSFQPFLANKRPLRLHILSVQHLTGYMLRTKVLMRILWLLNVVFASWRIKLQAQWITETHFSSAVGRWTSNTAQEQFQYDHASLVSLATPINALSLPDCWMHYLTICRVKRAFSCLPAFVFPLAVKPIKVGVHCKA